MSSIYFHITPYSLWESMIKINGLIPYDLGDNGVKLREYWPKLKNGIWLWPTMTEKLAHEIFYFQRYKKHDIYKFVILACRVEAKWLLKEKIQKRFAPNRVHFHHPMNLGLKEVHDEEFDICLDTIKPDRLNEYCIIEECITYQPYSKKLTQYWREK